MKLPPGVSRPALFEYLLRLGDERLVLGHRLSEWCGHAPILEEDLALANLALDLLGQAEALLELAGQVEDAGRDADALAYFRDAIDFRNPLLVELPRGDFGFTMARQFLLDVYSHLHYTQLCESRFQPLADRAAKALQEIRYHLRHSRQWMLRLGGGTDESNARAQRALDEMWRFTDELFAVDGVEAELAGAGVAVNRSSLRPDWDSQVAEVLEEAGLRVPSDEHAVEGGLQGRHTEHLGHMLAEMQILARSHPEASW